MGQSGLELYVNKGPLSRHAKDRIRQMLKEGKDRDAIYDAIGRSGRAVDKMIDEQGLLEHRYWLRPNLDVTLRLPKDLSRPEAARLAAVVRNLAF